MQQRTLALIKPDIVCHPILCQHVIEHIFARFSVVRVCRLHFSAHEARHFYRTHREKFFYERLVQHMISGPVLAFELTGTNTMDEWRAQLGPTKVYRAIFDAGRTGLRGEFGLSDTRNVGHGSDSSASVDAEIGAIDWCGAVHRKADVLRLIAIDRQ